MLYIGAHFNQKPPKFMSLSLSLKHLKLIKTHQINLFLYYSEEKNETLADYSYFFLSVHKKLT